MPAFSQGHIWLECNGEEMKEYGVTTEEKEEGGQKIIRKTCFIEIMAEKRFTMQWSYRQASGTPWGINASTLANGQKADGYIKYGLDWDSADLRFCSEGFRTSASTISPYIFKPCVLSEDEDLMTEKDFGSFVATLRPLRRISSESRAIHIERREASSRVDYNMDSKAAVVGFSVGYGEEQASSTPLASLSFSTCLETATPSLEAVFLYRTKADLISRGFIEEEKDEIAPKSDYSDVPVALSQPSAPRARNDARTVKEEVASQSKASPKHGRQQESSEAGPSGNTTQPAKKEKDKASAAASKARTKKEESQSQKKQRR